MDGINHPVHASTNHNWSLTMYTTLQQKRRQERAADDRVQELSATILRADILTSLYAKGEYTDRCLIDAISQTIGRLRRLRQQFERTDATD